MAAYYNENEPFAAAWLRELIKEGLITDGEVDERSIEEVQPHDLRRFTQCHFFAGIGVWSYALRNAGWSDDSPVWTGSCPCQSFSASGKRGGFSDKRHLWPTWFRLIRECRPVVCFGEQVASKDGLAWFDVVSADLENEGYSIGAVDTCAAGFGAPHIRQRLYFVADSGSERRDGQRLRLQSGQSRQAGAEVGRCGKDGLVADATKSRREGNMAGEVFGGRDSAWQDERTTGSGTVDELVYAEQPRLEGSADEGDSSQGRQASVRSTGSTSGTAGELADTGWQQDNQQRDRGQAEQGSDGQNNRILGGSGGELCGPTNGFWRNAEWIYCRDGKYRPTEPGSPPLATGITNRVGKLRGYGNAINAQVAQAFIEAYMSIG